METKNTEIKTFISKIIDKDYKKAHESLHKIVEDKLKSRIEKVVNK